MVLFDGKGIVDIINGLVNLFVVSTEVLAFLLGSEVVGVAMTTAISERNAFARSLVVEIALDVSATRTDHHRLRANARTA